ncbi:MAG: serine/threonine protein kinase [Planctomycetia bacterium]|nr:serine/threonine protein kinase [Planctomycetia bacterium]
MSSATVPGLLERLRTLCLLTPQQLTELDTLGAKFAEPRALARELMQRGWLTPYQINQLLQDRSQELLIGAYVLLERLGEGDMGTVFKARHQKMRRIVALKRIRRERLHDPDAVRYFYQEVRTAAQLSHPNLVHAFDADQIGDAHILVLEYVEGTNLLQLVKQQGPLPAEPACECIRQAACGLAYGHERGLIHRDIKPTKVMRSPKGLVKVLDLGLAHAPSQESMQRSASLGDPGALMGAFDCMAPEQAAGSPSVDIRADLYSLGCTLHFLLTGQSPFPNCTPEQKLYRHQYEEPTPVEQLAPGTPPEVREVVRRLLAKRREHRFQSPGELAGVLAGLYPPPVVSDSQVLTLPTPRPTATAADSDAAFGLMAADSFDTMRAASRPTPLSGGVPTLPRQRRWLPWLLLAGGGSFCVLLLIALLLYFSLRRSSSSPPLATATQRDPAAREIEAALANLRQPQKRRAALDRLLLYADRPQALDGILVGLNEAGFQTRARTALQTHGKALLPALQQAARDGRLTPELVAEIREQLSPAPRRWHVAGPFPIDPTREAFDLAEFLKHPNLTVKYPGADGQQAGWRDATLDANGRLNLNQFYQSEAKWSAYAYATFDAPDELAATVQIHGDDDVTLWHNGVKLRYEQGSHTRPPLDVPVRLTKGKNTLVLRVDSTGGGGWWFSCKVASTLPSELASPPLLRLFEDEASMVALLREGGGHVSLEEDDYYSGWAALRVAGDQRFNANLPHWGFRIVEAPQAGQYRFLRWAWRKRGGDKCQIQLATPHWGHRYHRGADHFMPSLRLGPDAPRDWVVETRDLFKDFGAFPLHGFALTPADGEWLLFDHFYLARSLDDFKHLPTVEPRKP